MQIHGFRLAVIFFNAEQDQKTLFYFGIDFIFYSYGRLPDSLHQCLHNLHSLFSTKFVNSVEFEIVITYYVA